MKHPLHFTFGCMSIALVGVLGLYEAHLSPVFAQSISPPIVIGDDDNKSVFFVESETAPYKGANIADAYKNGYSVLYANKSAKAKWVLPVTKGTPYCVAISLPKHMLFLPEQTYKIYDGSSGDSLLTTASLKQAQASGTSACGARSESSATRWLEIGTKVTSKTGIIRVEMSHTGLPAATTYLVLDAVELRPAGPTVPPVNLCGNGKVDNGEECDGTSALPSGRGCNKECKLTYCAMPKCAAVDPACPRLPGGGRDENGCQLNPCGIEDTSCTKLLCTSDSQCAKDEYCTTKDGVCLSNCEPGKACKDVCMGNCKKKSDICPAIACLKPPSPGCTTGTNANGCPDCSIEICPNKSLRVDNDSANFDTSGVSELLSNQSTAIGGSFRVAHRSWMPAMKAVWNFPNVTPGQPYDLRISKPRYEGSAQSVVYHVYDGKTEIGTFNLADISGGGASGGGSAVGGGGAAEKMASEQWVFINKTFTSKTGTINILLSASEQKDKGWLILDAIELVKSDRIDIGFCGDGKISGNEECDDMNSLNGDGCSASCKKESIGQMCTSDSQCSVGEYCTTKDGACLSGCKKGEACAAVCYGVCKKKIGVGFCGDGNVSGSEQCDDGNKFNKDGCSSVCKIESGWQCSTSNGSGVSGTDGGQAAGSIGGGMTAGGSVGGQIAGGGSSGNMPVEYNQSGRSYCTRVISVGFCGNGKVENREGCDDGNKKDGDGCNANCSVENGWQCSTDSGGGTSGGVQGGGSMGGGGQTVGGGGLSGNMPVEYNPNGRSYCTRVISVGFCGDGICSKDEEQMYCPACAMPQAGQPAYDCSCSQVCAADCGGSVKSCGNGKLEGSEQCDDKNTKAGDGCSPTCQAENGWECKKRYMDGAGTPYVVCFKKVCGNGEVTAGEQCDDKNLTNGDGCSSSCKAEAGWKCTTGSRFDGVSNNSIGGGSGGGGNYEFVGYGGGASVCVRDGLCGNGIVDKGEECDGSSPYPGSGCTKQCTLSYCRAPACAKPAPGCQYVKNDSLDEYGCPNSCGTLVCETGDLILESGRGNGKYDQMTYWVYESEVSLTPATNMKVATVVPDAYYCNGVCTFEVTVKNGNQTIAQGKASVTKDNANIASRELQVALPFSLTAGKSYTVGLVAKTTKSIGIFTAGAASPNVRNGGSFTINFARSDSADHRDRGPVGFSFYGTAETPPTNQSYFPGHKFECHDGYSEVSVSKMPMCMHADEWWKIAEQACARRCNKTKCGVNSWQVTGTNCTPQATNPSTKVQVFVDSNRDGQYSTSELSSAIRRMAADMKLSGNTSVSLASDFDGNGRVDDSDLLWLSEILGMTPIR